MAEITAAGQRGDKQAVLALYFAEVQRSLDALKAAGEWYPYDYWFRTAQANEFYVLSATIPGLNEAAETAIGYALTVDSSQPELVAGLLVLQRRLGRCDEARGTLVRLMLLAPGSPKVQKLAALESPCKGD
jgi:Flp pilus assembly protein TadD